MNEQVFWKIIESSATLPTVSGRFHYIENALAEYDMDAVFKFDKVLYWLLEKANFEDLWAAGCVLSDAYTAQNFINFRYWLVMQGQRVFKKALNDPEYLEMFTPDFKAENIDLNSYHLLGEVAARVYFQKTNQQDYKEATPYELQHQPLAVMQNKTKEEFSDVVPVLCKKMGWGNQIYKGRWVSDS